MTLSIPELAYQAAKNKGAYVREAWDAFEREHGPVTRICWMDGDHVVAELIPDAVRIANAAGLTHAA